MGYRTWLQVAIIIIPLSFFAACSQSGSDSTQAAIGGSGVPTIPQPVPGTSADVAQNSQNALGGIATEAAQCVNEGQLTSSNVDALYQAMMAAIQSGAASSDPGCLGQLESLAAQLAQAQNAYSAAELQSYLQQILAWALSQVGHLTPPIIPLPPPPPGSQNLLTFFAFADGEGSHIVGGKACPAGTMPVASFADCGGGTCYGDEVTCKTISAVQLSTDNATPVITDIWMTREGTHVPGGGGCPNGYTQIASVTDCGGGNCYGNQLFCAKFQTAAGLSPGDTAIGDYWQSSENLHIVGGPDCPSGYRAIGSTADCGMARCYGNQNICVLDVTITE